MIYVSRSVNYHHFFCVCVCDPAIFNVGHLFVYPFSMFDKMSWTEIPEKQVSLY